MEKQMEKNQLKQAENQNQRGRSMVEMLGVLAIIGVLSIGSIRGYRWAMDKHIANQILYEMNMNSAQLAMLLQRGDRDGVTLSLGSPYDEGTFKGVDYGFDYGCGEGEADEADDYKCYPGETGYYIQAKKLPESVADMVADSARNLQYYLDFDMAETSEGENEKTITMFFDVNANEAEEDSDSEVATTTLKPTRPPQTVPNTTTEAMATTLTTQSPTTATYATTLTTNAATTLTTQLPTTLTTNVATTLTTAPMTATATATTVIVSTGAVGECNDNNDCKRLKSNGNYYCHFHSSSSCSEQKGYAGTCEPITPDGTITINKKTFIAKRRNMSWWSAWNFCLANNRSMASISDLDCANTITKGTTDHCYQEDRTTSSTVKALHEKFGTDWFWLSDMYDSSCTAYFMHLDLFYVDANDRSVDNYALCE